MSNNLQFAGKIAYQSTNTTGQTYYLTRFLAADSKQFMPAMQAQSLTPSERCIVYQNLTTKGIIVQLATLEYLMLDTTTDAESGYITLTSELSKASSFQTTSTTDGQIWQVQDTSQSPPVTYPVYYAPVGQSAPSYLMAGDASSPLALNTITPDIGSLRQSKSGAGMDFRNVDLSGEDLSNIDFSKADFTGAILKGTKFDGATLTGAIFVEATLTGTSVNNAVLDQAQFSTTEQIADVSQVLWGTIKSAKGINLSGCTAQGAQLGIAIATSATIDCTGANLSNANFSGANLSGLNLTNANLSNTNLGNSTCQYTVFDNATLTNLAAVSATLTNTSMQGATAQGAKFTGANLKSATLSNAQFGAQTVFNNACLDNTVCTGANFSSTSMLNVSWQNSTADSINLEAADLSNSLLYMTNFTQAQMFGTNLTGCILIQAALKGATLAQATNNISTNLSNAQLQGADFTTAKINAGNLTGAGVALTAGVPLFVMPSTYVSDLNSGSLTDDVKTYFKQQNYPLGSGASLSSSTKSWQIDNSMDTDSSAIQTFYIDSSLNVYNQLVPNTVLFQLPSGDASFLNNPNPAPPLIAAFKNSGYSLSTQAKISSVSSWQIANTQDAPVNLPVIYETIAITQQQDGLHVYGSTKLWLKNFSKQGDIAFGSTIAIQAAMDGQSTCPNGYAKNDYPSDYTWEQMMTITVSQPSDSMSVSRS